MPRNLLLSLIALLPALACTAEPAEPAEPAGLAAPAAQDPAAGPVNEEKTMDDPLPGPAGAAGPQLATFGAGCFWCVEAVLEQVDGVLDVRSGYMGGTVPDPSYEQVCTGTTGHAEVVQVTFDPARLSYADLLEWFWQLHDPTTLNRQGADVGTQYRSVIFHHSAEQRALAEAARAAAQPRFPDPIVTEISPAATFYPAEAYHQDYYRGNKQQGYCRYVIAPKLDKLGLDK